MLQCLLLLKPRNLRAELYMSSLQVAMCKLNKMRKGLMKNPT